MSLVPYYLQYLSEICEGTRKTPAGIVLTEQEGETELIAALLSGDEKTFKLFRTQAPELVHLPDATYEWYSKHYLDRYYPVRFILHHQGIEFPRA